MKLLRNWDCRRRPRLGAAMLLLQTIHFFHFHPTSAQLINPGYVSPTEDTNCWVPCLYTPNENSPVPNTDCKVFYVCRNGRVTNKLACSNGRAFDVRIGACNHDSLVNCQDPTCPPTYYPTVSPTVDPTVSPTYSPSGGPTTSPTVSPTTSPTKSPTVSPTVSPTLSPSTSPTTSPTPAPNLATKHIQSKQSLLEEYILKSYTADGTTAYPSIRYNFEDFFTSLKLMSETRFGNEQDEGEEDATFGFMLWNSDRDKFRYGLVNVAAFLAQAAVEAVGDDTCDELNWQQVAGRYAISNSCGQEGRSYQDETCGMYSCIVNPSMEITAVHAANDIRAPPPMECRPGTGPNNYAGYWDTGSGQEIKNTPYSNTVGRIDIEGCCYWGRGVLLTRGSCNIGKLNYYMGARAAREGRPSLYPSIDFCVDPEATCASEVTGELRWTTAMFEWSERVQRYNNTGWVYEDELIRFFDDGMKDDSFIDAVSKIFAVGCHTTGCSDIEVRKANQRKSNFYLIINDVFGVDTIKIPTGLPTRRPTRPTPRPVNSNPQPYPNMQSQPRPTQRPTNPPNPRPAPNPPPTRRPILPPTRRPILPPTPRPTPRRSTPRPTPQPTQPRDTPRPTRPPNMVCSGVQGTIALEECREYIECLYGSVVSHRTCSAGLLYDASIGQCNWDYAVFQCNAPTQYPTRYPTPKPTRRTPRPTQTIPIEPTPHQQSPHQEPAGIIFPADLSPQVAITLNPYPQTVSEDPYPQAGSGNSYPQVGQGNSYPQTGSGNSYPQVGQGNSSPQTGSENSYPQSGPGNSYPQTGSGNSYPQAGQGNSYPQTGSGNSYSQTGPGNSYPQASPGQQFDPFPSGQNPTSPSSFTPGQRPGTPMPFQFIPNGYPYNSDSNGQQIETDWPTWSKVVPERIIGLEDNGTERLTLFKSSHYAVIFGLCAIHIILVLV